VLERFAVQIAPPVPDPPALAELANRLGAMRRAAATRAALEQAEAHRQFHVALVAMAGHRHPSRTSVNTDVIITAIG
jgi:DNA-binding GntR family transcriptional regulator